MADATQLRRAQETYATLCATLDGLEWNYEKDEENLTIETTAKGDDLRMPITVRIYPEKQLVWLLSYIPIEIPSEKRLEIAAAVSLVDNRLVNGCFEFDMRKGSLYFRMTNSFIGSTLSPEIFRYMIYCTCSTVDDYNDKFEALANGTIGINAFLNND